MTPERFAKLQRALDRRQPDLTVFMDAVNKPHNLSAIIRTADAVGIQRLHAISEGDAIRRHHMIAGGAKHWVAIKLHRSTRAALAALKADPVTASIPVVMVTSNAIGESDRVRYAAAAAILHKGALTAHALRAVLAQISSAAVRHVPFAEAASGARER